MAITKQLFERTGASTHTELSNINFKSSGLQADAYYLYTVNRPDLNGTQMMQSSYTKIVYAKVSGTYGRIERPRWQISAPDLIGNDKLHLMVGMRSAYTQPTQSTDYTLTNLNEAKYLFPNTDTSLGATSYQKVWTANQTFYTNYLVMQVLVEDGADAEFLNSQQFEVKFEYDVYE